MRLWAEALDIAHATRMKIDSDEPPFRGVTAVGVPVRALIKALADVVTMRRFAEFVNLPETICAIFRATSRGYEPLPIPAIEPRIDHGIF